MDPLAIIFLLLFVFALGGAVWLLMQRSAALANMARGEAELTAARASAESVTAELAGLREQVGAAVERAGEAAAVSAELTGRAAVTAEAHKAAIEAIGSRHVAEVESLAAKHAAALEAAAQMSAERLASVEKARLQIEEHVKTAEVKFADVFKSLASETLRGSTGEFLKLAGEKLTSVATQSQAEMDKRKQAIDELIKPIGEAITKTDVTLKGMELVRVGSYESLMEQVRTLTVSQHELRTETSKLAKALSGTQGKGRYGEVQLERVAELAGMIEHCDFKRQTAQEREEGERGKRPDMTVLMANGRSIAVDAKVNIQGYLDALDAATPEAAAEHLDKFAKAMGQQAKELSKKEYVSSAEFVVMFVPSERFIEAALMRQPSLFEDAMKHNVILAGPATLIGLLRVVAVGFQEQRVSRDAAKLGELAKELHRRFARTIDLVSDVGEAAEKTVKRYNELVGSIEGRLMPKLREFELTGGQSEKVITDVGAVTEVARQIDKSAARPGLPGLNNE